MTLSDDTAFTTGVGAGISLRGKVNAGGTYGIFAGIWAEKENSTTDNYSGCLKLGTRLSGSTTATVMTLGSDKSVTFAGAVSGITTLAGTGAISGFTSFDCTGTITSVTSTYAPVNAVRTTALTNAATGTLRIQGRSTGDMTDGFGTAIIAEIRDTAGVDNVIGQIYFFRDGADNSGGMAIQTYVAGTNTDKLRISAAGLVLRTRFDMMSGLTFYGTIINYLMVPFSFFSISYFLQSFPATIGVPMYIRSDLA
jgi:hypothetical protein